MWGLWCLFIVSVFSYMHLCHNISADAVFCTFFKEICHIRIWKNTQMISQKHEPFMRTKSFINPWFNVYSTVWRTVCACLGSVWCVGSGNCWENFEKPHWIIGAVKKKKKKKGFSFWGTRGVISNVRYLSKMKAPIEKTKKKWSFSERTAIQKGFQNCFEPIFLSR